jgi:hypothetical protein
MMQERAGRFTRRRERQLVEIAGLVRAGEDVRAGGLMVEHLAEFPADAAVVGGLLAGRGRAEAPDASAVPGEDRG